jgi:hypothetical protein
VGCRNSEIGSEFSPGNTPAERRMGCSMYTVRE